ncbi:MAG: type II secretion system F family protein [Patescibacteria group bacterium]
MQFAYQLSDSKGKISKGKLEAATLVDARNRLALQEGTIVSLEPILQDKKHKVLEFNLTIGHIRLLEKVMFAKHLSVMIKAGMSIDGALEVLSENASQLFSQRMNQVLSDVRKGNALSVSLKKYPRDFDNLFVNMVAVGESGGTLAKNLELLAAQQHKTYDLRNKIRAASIYPTIVIVLVIVLVAIISVYVLPRLMTFFVGLGTDLPLSTKILITTATFMEKYWWAVVGGVALIFVAIQVMLRFYNTKLWLHYIALKLPLFGKISRNMNLALFCRTMASLLNSGITIDKALQIVAETLPSAVYKEQITIVYHNILKGNSLADSLSNRKYFPSILYRMIRVGERSGNLSEVLEYLASFYEEDVDNTTKNFSNVLEPALLVIIGLTVAFAAISIIQPIFKLIQATGA